MADKSTHKERTRERILDEAAQALRVGGTEGISVGALMKRAGLTHGGFYAHFQSRDDLVANAVDRMFRDSAAMLDRFLGEHAGLPELAALVDYYLSEQMLLAPERGCPLPGLSGEVPRMAPAARTRFERGIEVFRSRIARVLTDAGYRDAEQRATSMLAEMVGAMTLARSMSDRRTASDILTNTRHALHGRLTPL
jgi:TetR/AcrR family transcriptional repressor of nem operon